MSTRGFDYTYDARSYAGLMGFGVLGLALWMRAQDESGLRRVGALGLMALMLGAGISTNYYGVLAFFPIAAGEMVLSWQRKRIRLDVAAALLAGALPLLVYLPLIRHNIAEFSPHAWNRPHGSMIAMSYLELVEGIVWPVVGLAILAWRRRNLYTGPQIPAAEQVSVWVLLGYPVLGFAVALGGAGMISPRCVIPVCCGFGLAAGVLGQRVLGASRWGGRVMVGVLLAWVLVREGVCASVLLEQRRSFLVLRDEAAAFKTKEILVADSSFVLPLYFYSAADVRSRMWVPIDFEAIHRLEADDSGEENLWGGRNGVFPFRVRRMDETPTDRPMLVIGRPDGWLAQRLQNELLMLTVEGDETSWSRVGGVFSPMAHPESRFLLVR